ncbi:ninjurin-B isoform X1 [Drosophila bipectinata]|uniref:ninjurin-B isoform X1 n=1 Tax=Drosophila bipectinata TaxID=42026 RepID=UPI001C89B9E0|nr:ninjurin-B [Drosophila bipectinata]
MDTNVEKISMEDSPNSEGSFVSTTSGPCCGDRGELDTEISIEELEVENQSISNLETPMSKKKKCSSDLSGGNSYATNKYVAEGKYSVNKYIFFNYFIFITGLMVFLIFYNDKVSTYIYCLILVILSLVLQILVGITLIFKRRLKRFKGRSYERTNDLLVMGVFLITVINIMLAAFTTTDGNGQK